MVMIFITPDLLTPTLLVFSLSFLSFGILILKNRRKTVVVLIISITLIIGVYQTALNNDLLALDQGDILETGFLQSEYSANITAGGTHLSPQLSNWYTVFNLTVMIGINSSDIVFSLVEQSHPETRFYQNNFSTSTLESYFPYFWLSFRLPFLYTVDGNVAN